MIYAHITAGVVDAVGTPPAKVFYDGRWWDLRDRNAESLALVGWYEVSGSPRPEDTATTTWDYSVELVGGTPTEVWTERPKTPAELEAEQEAANQQTIEEALLAALTTLHAIIDDTNANINTNPAARIKDLARVLRRVIRLVIRRFEDTT